MKGLTFTHGGGDYTRYQRTLGGVRRIERRAPVEDGGLERVWSTFEPSADAKALADAL